MDPFSSKPPQRSVDASAKPTDLAQRLAFLDLDEADVARLRPAPLFSRHEDDFVEAFYRHLFSFPETAAFLQDPALVERLKEAQRVHFASMLDAAWDEEYVERRHQVGDTHADVGIGPDVFLGAYNQYVQYCFRHLIPELGQRERADLERLLSVLKVIFLDVGLTLDAYFARSSESQRQALDMLWKANVELRQFAQLASHDLKTPLATVANLCDEALDEFGEQMPAGARDLVEAARQRTFRMSRMIDELLAFSASPEGVETNTEIFEPRGADRSSRAFVAGNTGKRSRAIDQRESTRSAGKQGSAARSLLQPALERREVSRQTAWSHSCGRRSAGE